MNIILFLSILILLLVCYITLNKSEFYSGESTSYAIPITQVESVY